ncbi:MAG TPA: glycoside hydrolase family 3 C-terminal domain-containing protein, partial [Mesotoga sp.]|nr:glycoside hydrolase family 3 C-terminal domain-containing protein [Mesotoga sp.]
ENRSRADITIPAAQRRLLRSVMEVNENVVLVVVSGRPLVLSWEEANVPAILQLWQPGHQAGNALAEVLYGIHNPSGKLTLTFPAAVGQIPVYYNRKNTGRPLFKKYIDIQDEPLFPFGWGLSYTDFDYEDLALSSDSPKMGEELKVSARVTNRGDYDGSETVMLFIRDVTASVTRPVMELKGFEKLFLKAGRSKNVQFDITEEMLTFLDGNLKPALEKGRFEVFLGRNSVEHLKGYFELI